MVGSPQVLVCTVNTVDGVEFCSVIINWIGPEGFYTNNNSRVIIDSEMDENPLYHNSYNSTLKFIYLMEGDEGIYTCSVTIVTIPNTVTFQTTEIKSLTSKKAAIHTSSSIMEYEYTVVHAPNASLIKVVH